MAESHISATVSGEAADSSAADRAYVEVRRRIISGQYPPEFRLRERELSEDLDVSRIPVREALQQLESDGFTINFPRRGSVVRQFTLKDVEELFDLRLSLEVYAAKRAAQAIADGQESPRLQELMEVAEAATATGDPEEIPRANTAIHAEIVAMTGNTLLQSSMKPLVGRLQWLFALTSDRDPNIQCAEHRSLCQAIYDGKPDLASALAYSHIELGREPSLNGLARVLPPA